jgi:hypothetical protein
MARGARLQMQSIESAARNTSGEPAAFCLRRRFTPPTQISATDPGRSWYPKSHGESRITAPEPITPENPQVVRLTKP